MRHTIKAIDPSILITNQHKSLAMACLLSSYLFIFDLFLILWVPPRWMDAGANRDGRMGAPMLDEDQDSRRASSRGIIPRAKIKTVKMTFVIVFGKH